MHGLFLFMPEKLNIFSQVIDGRPIHMLRPGTFTGQSGKPITFTADDMAEIAARFKQGRRPKPPITEGHDFGRAVGRVLDVWSDGTGLYGRPKWNAAGRQLLADEVYDGFSIEVSREGDGWTMIGGSLTNYPAVDGLQPVTLQAPTELESLALEASHAADALGELADALTEQSEQPALVDASLPEPDLSYAAVAAQVAQSLSAPPASAPARVDIPQPPEETSMSDTSQEETVEAPVLPPINDPAINARLDAYFAQNQAYMLQRERQIEQRLQADFERRMLELDQRSAIETFARTHTVTAPDRPLALSMPPDEFTKLLLATPPTVRNQWMALISSITRGGGTVSFDEIGSSADGGAEGDRWAILVNAKVATGMKRVDAIQAVGREHPDLYNAQMATRRKGGR